MKTYDDCFRPRHEPARAIYDAFQEASAVRSQGWQQREREAVLKAASDWAECNGVTPPSMHDVKMAESAAQGHVDYGSKWAIRIAELTIEKKT